MTAKRKTDDRPPLVDAAERERIRADLDCTFVVEAAAGTGKTTALVQRIVAVLAEGRATVDGIVAVTFTEKAAGELKLRMRSEIERARHAFDASSSQRGHLDDALARLEEARVGTIHAFCADILRERSIEAGIDPQFTVMTEPEARRLHAEAFQSWLQRTLEDPPEGVRRSLRRPAREGPVARLRMAAWTLADWRDFREPWRRDPFARDERIAALVGQAHELADLTERCSEPERDGLYKDTASVRRFSEQVRRAEAVAPRDLDGLEGALIELVWSFGRWAGRGRRFADGLDRADVVAVRDAFKSALGDFARDADADLAALLQGELAGVTERYEELKQRNGKLDFVDLLLRARDLVRDDLQVRTDFQVRFQRIFIDEFQDTDPLQAELLLLLGGNDPQVADWHEVEPVPGKLFLVGDPKQAIYRFRRADVGTYFEVRDLLARGGAECLRLTTSFRSTPQIQAVVNHAFSVEMDGNRESLQAEYVPLAAVRADGHDQPGVVALPVPAPYGQRGIVYAAIEESLPGAVGGFVEWLLNESGWTVTTREDPETRVPVRAQHICLLFRRFDSFYSGDVTRPYVESLEARGVRHLLVGGRSFHMREEVETMRTALTAIEWPDDELSLFATLRGALFAVGDEALLEYRHRFGRMHPFRRPSADVPERLQPIVDSLELVARLHAQRNRRPVAETIHRLLEETRAHAAFALRPSGEQALANVLHVADQARTYEATGGISFRGFVERLVDEADSGRASEAPILEEGSDGVRLMTTHKAKGLEFPVVILADMTAPRAQRTASRTIDPVRGMCAMRLAGWSPNELLERGDIERERDTAEGVRLTYVAATRARDLLVVPVIGDGPFDRGWAAMLNRAVYPAKASWSSPSVASGCPQTFGKHSVLNHPDPQCNEVRPGLHRIEAEGGAAHEVVWWDPAVLRLQAPPMRGVRNIDLIGKHVDPSVVAADRERYEKWARDRERAVESGRRPTLAVETATERSKDETDTGDCVAVVTLDRSAGRPGGRRFGALVHTTLETVALDAARDGIEGAATLRGRVLGARAHEIEAAVDAIEQLFAHPVMERARAAAGRGECRRETPVMLRLPADALGGRPIVDGVVDLAFREDGSWTVIDFKTDRPDAAALAGYKRQVAIYASGIAAATGEAASPMLVLV